MAVTVCKQCRQEFNASTARCPFCGNRRSTFSSKESLALGFAILVGGLLVLGALNQRSEPPPLVRPLTPEQVDLQARIPLYIERLRQIKHGLRYPSSFHLISGLEFSADHTLCFAYYAKNDYGETDVTVAWLFKGSLTSDVLLHDLRSEMIPEDGSLFWLRFAPTCSGQPIHNLTTELREGIRAGG
jgi:hypothetical protein